MQIILASKSPRRQKLLSYLIEDFKIITADLDEENFLPLARSPEEFVTKLSLAKAKKVISQHKISNSLIIAADTIVVLPKKDKFQIIGKPENREDAKKILELLKNKTHQVYTGFSILNQKTNQFISDFSLSHVTFKNFSDKLLDSYIDTFKPFDKAGAYAIQEMSSNYIANFDGSLSGIIGLPLEKLAPYLEQLSIKLKPNWQKLFQTNFNFS